MPRTHPAIERSPFPFAALDLTLFLLVVMAIGALIAFLAPRFARMAGWLVVAGSVVGSIIAYMRITAGTSDYVGGVMAIIGGIVAAVILVVGCALGFGMIGGVGTILGVKRGVAPRPHGDDRGP